MPYTRPSGLGISPARGQVMLRILWDNAMWLLDHPDTLCRSVVTLYWPCQRSVTECEIEIALMEGQGWKVVSYPWRVEA
jgi:hypothetical protein